MRGCMKSVMAFGLVALISAPAMAQQRGQGGMGMGGGMGGVNMIANASVQKELKMDEGQVKEATEVAMGLRTKMQEARSTLEGLEGQERMQKQMELTRTHNAEGMKKLDGILKPEQMKRFKQIELQAQGVNAFTSPEVAKALKVTDEQKEKVTALLASMREQMTDAREAAGDDRQAMMQKTTAIRKETFTKAVALMSDDQKKMWKEMTGEPFEMVQGPRPAR